MVGEVAEYNSACVNTSRRSSDGLNSPATREYLVAVLINKTGEKPMTKNIILAITLCSFLSACAGRDPNPVMAVQYGDYKKSCKALEFEISQAENEIQRLLPKKDKMGANVALGVAGAFLLVPWFFMDFKNAEGQEYEAYRQRYNHLTSIAVDKDCGVNKKNYPSVQEIQKKQEMQNKKVKKSKKSGFND